MIALASRELWNGGKQHTSSLLVAFITSVFATMMIEMDIVLRVQSVGGQFIKHGYVVLLLDVLDVLFFFVAVFVACIVTANTFGIIMAGRARHIALMRLLGASASTLRGAIAIEGAVVGFVGAALGLVVGLLVTQISYGALVTSGTFVNTPISTLSPLLVAPVIVGLVSTTGAAWFGSRKILGVSPIEATGATQEPRIVIVSEIPRRLRTLIIVSFFGGIALLIAGVAIGLKTPFGLLVAAPGGALSFVGFVLGSTFFIPVLLKAAGRLTGSSTPSVLASANALRYPARSARSTIGLVIGVTLVTMFSVAGQSFLAQTGPVAAGADAADADGDRAFLQLTMGILTVLIGFSLVIAAIGLVNSLSLSVIQRRREIGLLRALGFTKQQVRMMILAESIQLTVVGGATGLVLGTVYGWAGALAAISSNHHIGGFFWPTIPAWIILSIVAGAIVLAIVSSAVPARSAVRVSPVRALAIE
ncbi:ABC transporter permease [Subtercola frigoramans]|uniref:ABC transport system permease protein n=1 Tax=Subtercola frigoramans TaxID=120298 RepID=A0ABS2L3G1_9MICO|nr:FtsX-like permease family protein [Subtercola frigoramans]MBM7471641.1 putative ABC transport system permease protein [Subtercola frigoramans]